MQDDKTTRTLRRVLRDVFESHKAADPAETLRLECLICFNCALFRLFGTSDFIETLGFMDVHEWNASAWAKVAGVAVTLWRRGASSFTDAYGPAKHWHKKRFQNEKDLSTFVEDWRLLDR